MLTHRNLLFTATASGRLRRIVRSDFVIQLVPVAHVFGLASVLLCAISAGARIALVPRFDPARLADALQSGITVLQGVPTMYAKLLEHLESTGRPLTAPGRATSRPVALPSTLIGSVPSSAASACRSTTAMD